MPASPDTQRAIERANHLSRSEADRLLRQIGSEEREVCSTDTHDRPIDRQDARVIEWASKWLTDYSARKILHSA